MKQVTLIAGLIGTALLSSTPVHSAKLPPLEKISPGIVAAARQAVAEQRQIAAEQKATGQAVSRQDKVTVDITGTIQAGTIYSSDGACGYEPNDVLVLWIQAKGQWVSVTCAGNTLNTCLNTRIGQRIRVQGSMLTAPDFLDADFDACDTSTWYPGPVNFFLATKVTK